MNTPQYTLVGYTGNTMFVFHGTFTELTDKITEYKITESTIKRYKKPTHWRVLLAELCAN